MAQGFKGRSFVSLIDWGAEDLLAVLDTADELKRMARRGVREPLLQGRVLGMIFQKPSTRTRVSFDVAMRHLGGSALYLGASDLQLGRGETVPDTARVLGRYVDAVMARTFAHRDVLDLAEHAGVPVINGLTDFDHPCQALADAETLREVYVPRGRALEDLTVAYVGDGNNVCHSLLHASARFGFRLRVAHPRGYAPQAAVVAAAGPRAQVGEDPREAVRGADAIYTDVWASMGQEAEHAERVGRFRPYQVNEALCALARPDHVVLHCLPAHRGEEICDSVVDGPHSQVWRQAENRLHAQKALLALVIP
ncbi:MAG: ornithine carbamoyltransferase [Planctomycetes bacterium]|nr:ornithine carbamoyltransferase [Planctomycetota bacterium]